MGKPVHKTHLRESEVKEHEKKQYPEVVTIRTWKEYLGECLLIVFSVILALVVTEFINDLNDKRRTSEILHELKQELIENKKMEEEQYAYHLQVLKNIDSALKYPVISNRFINNEEINLKIIAPEGVMRHDLNDVAWQVAKQNNIFSKISISTYSLLNDIYNNQQRITNSEDKIAQILLSFESRQPENLRSTLILIRDSYHGWDVDRAPMLLSLYQQAIDKLSKY
jgi:hypothetical protein